MKTSHRFPLIKQLILALLVIFSFHFVASPAHAGSEDFWKTLLNNIDDEKSHRVVDFLVYEPIHVADGGAVDGNSELVGFDAETDGLRDAILATFKEVAGKREWHPSYFTNRAAIRKFYDGLKSFNEKNSKLKFLKDIVEAFNKKSSDNHFETMVYAYMNNTEVTVFVYDVTKPYEFNSARKTFADGAGPDSRRSTVKNAFYDALVNAFGAPSP